ncbi:MAG: M48 family metalloprotease, partial [Candidatus Anstonellaceae archaeon]
MEELNCIIGPCLSAFSKDPTGTAAAVLVGSIAAVSLYKAATGKSVRSKIRWSYLLVFGMLFLISYFSFSMSCHANLPICSEHAAMYSIPTAIIGSLLFGYFILPRIYLAWNKAKLDNSLSSLLPQSVPVYVADKGKPFAFSFGGFGKWIVVSQGMLDILTKNELRAVLLHEYGHIKNKSSLYKLSSSIYSRLPVLNAFLDSDALDSEEEIR